MKVLIAGAKGQLGWELQRTAPAHLDLYACDRQDLDIRDAKSVQQIIDDVNPMIVINAAAYTAVDRAEQDSDTAYAVNRDGVAHLARSSASCGARFIHVSTDYVFDGTQDRPYSPDDRPNPQCVYGASKFAGEGAVIEALSPDQTLIIRTSWVYSAHGQNFVKTMLRLMQDRDQVDVVVDQVGSPTWAGGLAEAIWRAVSCKLTGVHHWTDAGVASWYDFAVAIQEEAIHLKLLEKPIPIRPISTSEYPLPAKRPYFSVLDKLDTWAKIDINPSHWRESLRSMLKELAIGRAEDGVRVKR
ncbi:MAG: dTDP-4-dehydrorhamnose reductase [Pseudomonadota bacterium]